MLQGPGCYRRSRVLSLSLSGKVSLTCCRLHTSLEESSLCDADLNLTGHTPGQDHQISRNMEPIYSSFTHSTVNECNQSVHQFVPPVNRNRRKLSGSVTPRQRCSRVNQGRESCEPDTV
ncbi:hypothetical protein RRG08_053257 [Elysia crispata]|uniref:Uncharacterized protein n=1 Tax=Elysia crispata TaxID=231223 RepID=A0AAE1E1K1_9GAST|nr:hypothetical protein RRG08_053257 [Elysia crispata]